MTPTCQANPTDSVNLPLHISPQLRIWKRVCGEQRDKANASKGTQTLKVSTSDKHGMVKTKVELPFMSRHF